MTCSIDDTGVVVIISTDALPDAYSLQTMILGPSTKLESQFRLTFNMILNLIRVESMQVEDMMKQSFIEDATQRHLPQQRRLLHEQEERLALCPKLDCITCVRDIDDFYFLSIKFLRLNREIWHTVVTESFMGSKFLAPGRIIISHTPLGRCLLSVVVKVGKRSTPSTTPLRLKNASGGKQEGSRLI